MVVPIYSFIFYCFKLVKNALGLLYILVYSQCSFGGNTTCFCFGSFAFVSKSRRAWLPFFSISKGTGVESL